MKRKIAIYGLLMPVLLLTGCSLFSKSVSSDEFLEKTKNPDPHPYTKAVLTYYCKQTISGETKEINSEEEYFYNATQSTWEFSSGDHRFPPSLFNMKAHDYAEYINMPSEASSSVRQYFVNPYKINSTDYTTIGDLETKSVTKLEFNKYCLLTKFNLKKSVENDKKYEYVEKVTIKYS